MRKTGFFVSVFLLLFTSIIQAQQSNVTYELTDLGSNSWQYNYTISNIGLTTPIEEFTIYFDEGLYQNLAIVGPTPDGWDAIVWQPELGLGSGAYDALTIGAGIGFGESIGGFNARFDWLGAGNPGSQYYEIVNTTDFTVMDSGYTVPEPATLVLIGLGNLFLLRGKRSRYFR
jgi:hypothetical protein